MYKLFQRQKLKNILEFYITVNLRLMWQGASGASGRCGPYLRGMRAGDAIVDAGDADGPGMRTVREDCESAFRRRDCSGLSCLKLRPAGGGGGV